MVRSNGIVSLSLIYSQARELSDLLKTEAITTANLKILRGLSALLISKQDPVAIFISENEKKWPGTCPANPLTAKINTIQIIVGVLKVLG